MIIESPSLCARPKVSVLMVTYNHALYIEQAVRSTLQQKTDFPYEVIVGDDVSTDGTREKLLELQREFPDRLRLLLHEKNLGGFGKLNMMATLGQCRGDYVCVLDGDDYYSSPEKLQRQADFLDANPGCPACFHGYQRLHPDGSVLHISMDFIKSDDNLATLEYVLRFAFPHILTVMFRRGVWGTYPDWFTEVAMPDWSTWVLLGERGPLGFVGGGAMATYRVHATNYWINRPLLNRTRDELFALETFARHLKGRCGKELSRMIATREFWLVEALLQHREGPAARRTFWRAFYHWLGRGGTSPAWVLRYGLRAYGLRPIHGE